VVCPGLVGATNFYSTAYNPATGLFYVNTMEACNIFTKRDSPEWRAGAGFAGGGTRGVPDEKAQKFMRAYNLETGKLVWERPENGNGDAWSGALSTAGGLVFIGATRDRRFRAFDSKTGKELWSVRTDYNVTAIPMTYQGKDGKQYVAVTAATSGQGGNESLLVFALP